MKARSSKGKACLLHQPSGSACSQSSWGKVPDSSVDMVLMLTD